MNVFDTDWTTEPAAAGLELAISDPILASSVPDGTSVRVDMLRRQRYAHRVVVACDAATVAGHATVELGSPGGFWDSVGLGGVGEIRMLVTRASYRRRGVAAAIVAHLAAASDVPLVAAWYPHNPQGGRLFADWEQLGTHRNPAGVDVVCARLITCNQPTCGGHIDRQPQRRSAGRNWRQLDGAEQ